MKEDLLQFVWENLLFDRSDLTTTDGQELSIIESGDIQHGQGPDLNNAKIRIGDQMWVGTVEIHMRSSEWYAHGHHMDPAYENVALHVVLEHDRIATTTSGRNLFALELKNRLDTNSIRKYDQLMKNRNWVPCAEQINSVDEQLIGGWLETLLVRRLERKSLEIMKDLRAETNNEGEVFYRSLCRTLGQKENAEPFSVLARSMPFRLLRKYHGDMFQMESLLFGQAGLLGRDFHTDYANKLNKEYRALANALQLHPMDGISWKFGRVRPNSFPTVRIALLAGLIKQIDGNPMSIMESDSADKMIAKLRVAASSDWNDRYVLDELNVSRVKRVGQVLARNILVNTVIPFMFTLGRYRKEQHRIDRALSLLNELPTADDRIVRSWKKIGIDSDSMARSQALIELKNEFCTPKKCLNCRIGEALMNSNVK